MFPGDDDEGASGLRLSNIFTTLAHFRSDTPDGAFSVGPEGVGIGLSAFSTDAEDNAQAALHVVGGQASRPPFAEANIIVEDRNETAADRELLQLTNNGTAEDPIRGSKH